jgi:hypothetical protein
MAVVAAAAVVEAVVARGAVTAEWVVLRGLFGGFGRVTECTQWSFWVGA